MTDLLGSRVDHGTDYDQRCDVQSCRSWHCASVLPSAWVASVPSRRDDWQRCQQQVCLYSSTTSRCANKKTTVYQQRQYEIEPNLCKLLYMSIHTTCSAKFIETTDIVWYAACNSLKFKVYPFKQTKIKNIINIKHTDIKKQNNSADNLLSALLFLSKTRSLFICLLWKNAVFNLKLGPRIFESNQIF